MKLVSLLIEGGWASTLTQDTKLTPEVVRECVQLYKKFVSDFNQFLKSKGEPEIEEGDPIGSAYYYERDAKENPDKEYGDVDVLFYIPRIEGMTDNANKNKYKELIKQFLEGNSDVSTENGNFLIFKLKDGGYAQIDLVMAYSDSKEWAKGRMTPERGLKGAIGGTLYSSLAEVLDLSINISGVEAKVKDGVPVSFRRSKVDRIDTVSRDISKFGLDICRYYYKIVTGKDPKEMKVSPGLKKNPGMDPKDVKNQDIALMVKGIGETLEMNGLFGKANLSNIESYSDFINQVSQVYREKMIDSIESSKFEKASGAEGERKAKEAKEKLTKGMEQVLQYLK
jgi:hypothetical protein